MFHINEYLSHNQCYLDEKELLEMVPEQGVAI